MEELLTRYSPTDIVLFTFSLILAIQGGWKLWDYFKGKYYTRFDRDYKKKKEKEILRKNDEDFKVQHEEITQLYSSLEKRIDTLTNTMEHRFGMLDEQISELKQSDMLDIKQSIVKEYHYFVEKQKWIDDFSLDVLELRFKKYTEEGGNSYVAGLMSEIRQLPKHPPV